jgi:XapX domain-containing protein
MVNNKDIKIRRLVMKEVILAFIAGLIVGILFKFLKLPLPAPPVFSAVVGVFGVYFGGVIAEYLRAFFS